MKLFFYDTETTGTDEKKHGIIQLSAIIDIDGEVKETLNLRIKPFPEDEICDDALAVNGVSLDSFEFFEEPKRAYSRLVFTLSSYCDKYAKGDKFVMGAYNEPFDNRFLRSFFEKNKDKYFGSYFNHRNIDPLPMIRWLEFLGLISLENHKLATVCKHFGIEINAHDAMSDITATRDLVYAIKERFGALSPQMFAAVEPSIAGTSVGAAEETKDEGAQGKENT